MQPTNCSIFNVSPRKFNILKLHCQYRIGNGSQEISWSLEGYWLYALAVQGLLLLSKVLSKAKGQIQDRPRHDWIPLSYHRCTPKGQKDLALMLNAIGNLNFSVKLTLGKLWAYQNFQAACNHESYLKITWLKNCLRWRNSMLTISIGNVIGE